MQNATIWLDHTTRVLTKICITFKTKHDVSCVYISTHVWDYNATENSINKSESQAVARVMQQPS